MCVHAPVYHMCVVIPEEGIGSLRAGVLVVRSYLPWVLVTKLRSSQRAEVLLTSVSF